jgi:hypothetical protein
MVECEVDETDGRDGKTDERTAITVCFVNTFIHVDMC